MSDLRKRGLVKRTIKYTNKDGEVKNQYITVGEYFSTDGGNRQAIKLLATAISEEVWLNIYPLEEQGISQTHEFNKQAHKKSDDVVLEDIDDKPIDLSTIPF